MKKFALFVVSMMLIASSSAISFASVDPSNVTIGRTLAEMNSSVDENNRNQILALADSGVENAQTDGFNLFRLFSTSTLTYSWKVECSNSTFTGGAKAIATSDATEPIDYIYARVKSYDSDDTLLDEAEDSSSNASHAGAKAGNGSGFVIGDYAYGNHVFKNDGYKDMTKESSDTW